MGFFAIILVAVLLAHASGRWLGPLIGYSSVGTEFMGRGILLAVLSVSLGLLIFALSSPKWYERLAIQFSTSRPRPYGLLGRDLTLATLAISAIEGAQMTVCRAMIADVSKVPWGMNMCDFVADGPVGGPILWLEGLGLVFVLCWHMAKAR